MLGKRDPIFWTATVIFAAALALGVTVGNVWFLLMVVSYLLRPTLHSLGFFKTLVDERQLQIHYRASNVGFAVMVVGNIMVTLHLMGKSDHTWEMLIGVLMFGLAARALAGLLLVGDPLIAGQRTLFGVGLLAALFAAMDAGFPYVLIATLPGVLLVVLGVVAPRNPRATAAVVATLAVLFCVVMLPPALRQPGGPNWGTTSVFGLILTPLLIAAMLLWRGAAALNEPDTPSSGTSARTTQ